jgi:hypothetical protein
LIMMQLVTACHFHDNNYAQVQPVVVGKPRNP